MIWKFGRSLLIVVSMMVGLFSATHAQFLSSTFYLKVHEIGATGGDSMTLGTHVNATYHLDASLGEQIAPPPPPGGLDVVFLPYPNRPDLSWDRGLLHKCLLPFVSIAKKDTFIIGLNDADPAGQTATILFEWDSAAIATICDSMFLLDPTNQIGPPAKIDMKAQSSLSVDGLLSLINKMRIYRYGCDTPFTSGVRKISPTVPDEFSLSQGYPNPFNPTTKLDFDIQKSSITDISVYNMLGQKISTLVSRQLTPGSYKAEWNGTNDLGVAVTSGVYFVRMSAKAIDGKGQAETFSAVRKLMYMK